MPSPIEFRIRGFDKLREIAGHSKAAEAVIRERLLQKAKDFGNDAVARMRRDYLSGPRPEKLGVKSGLLRARTIFVTIQDGPKVLVRFGNDLPYGAIHEFGGTTHPRITDKMRRFAWAMYYQTKESHWKYIALTKKETLTIKIKARPYLAPGVADAYPGLVSAVEDMLTATANEMLHV